MAVCIYCGERAGLLVRSCKECRRLAETAQACAGQVGFSELLDRLEETGVHPEKIMRFLKADPDGRGSVRDRLTADMTNELLQIMGINERQTADDVQRIRKTTEKPPGSNQGNAD